MRGVAPQAQCSGGRVDRRGPPGAKAQPRRRAILLHRQSRGGAAGGISREGTVCNHRYVRQKFRQRPI